MSGCVSSTVGVGRVPGASMVSVIGGANVVVLGGALPAGRLLTTLVKGGHV